TTFSSLSKIHHSLSSSLTFFTKLSLKLFSSSNSSICLSVELTTSVSTSMLASFASDLSSDHVPSLYHFNWLRETTHHLRDYHYFSIILSLHEPYSYCKASIDPLWQ